MTNEELDALVERLRSDTYNMVVGHKAMHDGAAAITALRAERQQLAEAVCGGEDFPACWSQPLLKLLSKSHAAGNATTAP